MGGRVIHHSSDHHGMATSVAVMHRDGESEETV